MTAVTFNAAPRVASTLQRIVATLGDAIDAFAAYRMQHAVPEHEFQRADDEIKRCRQMMRASREDADR